MLPISRFFTFGPLFVIGEVNYIVEFWEAV